MRHFFILIFIVISIHKTEAQHQVTWAFKGSVFSPMIASGHMFEDNSRPDGEFGFSLGGGLVYIAKEKWFVTGSISAYYQRYHFHYLEDELGFFYSAYFSGALSVYRKIYVSPKYNNIMLYAGTAINGFPFMSKKTGYMSGDAGPYTTNTAFKEKYYPELALGIGRRIWKGKVIWIASVHAAIPKNYLFDVTIYPSTGTEHAQKNFRDIKFMYSIDYFPFINHIRKPRVRNSIFYKKKVKRGQNINNCPVK